MYGMNHEMNIYIKKHSDKQRYHNIFERMIYENEEDVVMKLNVYKLWEDISTKKVL